MQICFISILKLASLNISLTFFRIWSVFYLDVFLKSTSLSSLYKPADCLSSLFDNKDSIWMSTSLHISAQSKLPMMTYKQLSIFFFKGLLPLYNKDFLQCFITHKSFSGISMYCWVNRIVLSNISSDIDRQNSAISNWINLH